MTVNNWERNRCKPRLHIVPKIVEFLGYSPFPTNENRTIVDKIRTYRLTHGLSQRNLVKILKINPTTLARWEKGRSKPGAILSRRLAKLLSSSACGVLQRTPTDAGRDSLSQES